MGLRTAQQRAGQRAGAQCLPQVESHHVGMREFVGHLDGPDAGSRSDVQDVLRVLDGGVEEVVVHQQQDDFVMEVQAVLLRLAAVPSAEFRRMRVVGAHLVCGAQVLVCAVVGVVAAAWPAGGQRTYDGGCGCGRGVPFSMMYSLIDDCRLSVVWYLQRAGQQSTTNNSSTRVCARTRSTRSPSR